MYYYYIICFNFSVLKTFLHDPLVEWSKPVKGHSKAPPNETGEVVNEKVGKSCSLAWANSVSLFIRELIPDIISEQENWLPWNLKLVKTSRVDRYTLKISFLPQPPFSTQGLAYAKYML